MQNGYIFNDTISNNICVNPDEFDEDRLYTVSKITNIYDFIINLPLKYDTRIGDDGIGLSQGQRQRILIARAIYKNPSYLFLDEATNSLDTKNENDIVSNLSTYFINKTKIIIAHRLSTIRNADQIVLIEAGRIKEIGTHRELIAQKGIYYNLVNKQL
ncbi:ABC transporter, ATP-binding protein [Prevotella amnii]|nr:ABC transporter, ATP-binding protein [Prevotella amnii]